MRPELLAQMAAVQQTHWWFAARRDILSSVIDGLALPAAQPRVLEIGCGPGGNLAMLARHGSLSAMEYAPEARAAAGRLGLCPVEAGGLPEPVPFADGSFDLVCLLDVLEHVEHDDAALARVARLLKPGGRLLLTVPAYQWLWSGHDVDHHHHRRYTAGRVRAKATKAGLVVHRAGYFNTVLFPLIAIARLAGKLAGRKGGDTETALPSPWLNATLRTLFGAERPLVARMGLPFGTSVIAVLGRPS
ncbi:bifunctional 2-polyprenyl-6-hydroxyphenol methylase/3-demethylubiquinol 3-O-methyltransferase UbiG [Acidovorax sp. A1169]|uniref:class I SAM-dependent methyltransferase n=1 Tax=Acidovorax sp. A1169 TaxID=3059524 RepID=UPI002737FD02|nr:class I SAM-dependent methyltransferase [Acidovorax sp. A1169]MDP4076706.1 class I SAM-dependent methyltransferase [Acidovorax sp. A1169]